MTLERAMKESGHTMRSLGRILKISPTAVFRLAKNGEYPARLPAMILSRRIQEAFPGVEVSLPPRTKIYHAIDDDRLVNEGLELMQMDNDVLKLFGLRRNPFLNDVEEEADVFQHKGLETVSQAIRDAIHERGFLAVVGESGAGKTTIWDGIESEFLQDDALIICRPKLKDKEQLSPEHLCRALIYGLLGEDCKVKGNAEDRGRQLSAALRDLRMGGEDRKAVLVVDDAHFASTSVLRQLKTFYEEKIGRYRLLTIVLVGLPELKNKLARFPEIGNRIRLVNVPPVPVEAYLKHKLARVGSSPDKIFDPAGLHAFIERFRAPRKSPMGHPLIINRTCIWAMSKVNQNGGLPGARVTQAVIDELPSEQAIRQVATKERAA
jgi:type II secretory pathway predicted ATPase ExeA